jgi:hypothetical protein
MYRNTAPLEESFVGDNASLISFRTAFGDEVRLAKSKAPSPEPPGVNWDKLGLVKYTVSLP